VTTITLTFANPHIEDIALNRRESLLNYLEHPLTAPEPMDPTCLSDADRAEYDRARMDYLSGGVFLATSTVMSGQLLLARAFQENRFRNSGHAGVILSGDSSLGKTTTAKGLMRWVLTQYAQQVPDWRRYDHVPVMYVEVPPGSNAKALLKEMANFFGLPVLSRDSMADLRTKVVAAMRRARTQLVVVDELQNLAGRGAGLGEAVDLLKGLHNDVAATFLYCGIDVTNSTLMSGTRGQQLKSRFAVLELHRYQWSNAQHRKEWKGLVRGFERQLQLRDHPAGTLDSHLEYLYQRTGGSIGSLGRLLTGAAIDLIQRREPVERLQTTHLDAYRLDYTAELFFQNTLTKKATSKMTAIEKVMA